MNTPEGQEATEQEEYCDNCGRVMVLRRGPFGMFMSCPDYNADPPCKTFRKLSQKQQQKQAVPKPTGEDCPACGKPLVLRQGSYGEFVSCSVASCPSGVFISGLPAVFSLVNVQLDLSFLLYAEQA